MKTDTTDNPAVGDPAATVAPQIVSQIGDAPARGILPNISLHLAGESQLFHSRSAADGENNDPLFRRDVRGTNLPFVKGTAKKGAVVPLTHHVNEHVTWITKASLKCTRKDETTS